jgi:dTDP-4-dehydrorhamnose reductase
MSLLVFGGGGQLGQELLAQAVERQISIVPRTHGETDIADATAVTAILANVKPRLVVNAAAYTKVDRAEREPEAARRANAEAPGTLARLCAARDIPLIHISTDFVFDGSKASAYREDDAIAPLGVYGATKAAGEQAVREACPHHLILRTSWVYGIFGANFLKTMLRLAGERDEIRVVADQHGCPTGTADLAEVILAIAPRVAAGNAPWGTYHFAGNGATTWHGFAREIIAAGAQRLGTGPKVTAVTSADYPTAARRPANSELDSSRFAAAFGLRALPWQERTCAVVSALLS